MADKMMRLAGRGDDGTAKAINTDNQGNAKIVTAGTIVHMHEGTTEVSNGKVLDVRNYGLLLVRIYGNHDATISFLGAIGGGYSFVNAKKIDDGRVMTSASENGYYLIDCRGLEIVQTRVTSYNSGTVNVTARGESYSTEIIERPPRTILIQNTTAIAAGQTISLISDTQRITEIETLEFSTNSPNSVFLHLEDGVHRLSRLLQRQGYNMQDLGPENLYLNGSSLWEIEKYDDEENSYKITLKKPLKTNRFFNLRIQNISDNELRAGLLCIGKHI